MKLNEVLDFLDFRAEVELPNAEGVKELREELVNEGYVDTDEFDKPLVRLVDKTDVYFGNIAKERWPLPARNLAKSILNRLDIYVKDYVIDPIVEKIHYTCPLEDLTTLDLTGLIKKAEELEVDLDGLEEIGKVIADPDTIEVDIAIPA